MLSESWTSGLACRRLANKPMKLTVAFGARRSSAGR